MKKKLWGDNYQKVSRRQDHSITILINQKKKGLVGEEEGKPCQNPRKPVIFRSQVRKLLKQERAVKAKAEFG